MTRAQSGRKGGTLSGRQRSDAARERARQRGLDMASHVDPQFRGDLEMLLRAGILDAWLVLVEREAYRRGYCVRDERVRREASEDSRAAIVATARARFSEGSAA